MPVVKASTATRQKTYGDLATMNLTIATEVLRQVRAVPIYATTTPFLPSGDFRIDIDCDANDPGQICFRKHHDNYGRLLCYVYKSGVQEGWNPYFFEIWAFSALSPPAHGGRSRAQASGVTIWNIATNVGGNRRDYATLESGLHLRDGIVHDYRLFGLQGGIAGVYPL